MVGAGLPCPSPIYRPLYSSAHNRFYTPCGRMRTLDRGGIAFSGKYRMDRQETIEFLLDHYENPRNNGPLDHADVSLCGGNPGCADIITMHARFGKDGKLEAVNWEGEGCTISRAAASYVTEITHGMTAEEVEAMTFEDLIEQLGRELVMTRPTCATLALGTLKKGVHEYDMHKRAENAT
jgi:nitrogen fixation protein NifU and related proteins